MYVDTIYIPYQSLTQEFKILPISDIHYGHKSCDVQKLKRDLAQKVDERTIIFGLGDWADSIIVPDKRYRKDFDGTETGAANRRAGLHFPALREADIRHRRREPRRRCEQELRHADDEAPVR